MSDDIPYVLDLKRLYRCHRTGKRTLLCLECKNNTPTPGCDLVEQAGGVYGWSESNCQYERIGSV